MTTSPSSPTSTPSSWLCWPRNLSPTSTATAARPTSLMQRSFATHEHRLVEAVELVRACDECMGLLRDKIRAREAQIHRAAEMEEVLGPGLPTPRRVWGMSLE